MSVPTFPCPSGETCFAPECCAHQQCIHAQEAKSHDSQQLPEWVVPANEPNPNPEPTDTEILDFMEARAADAFGTVGYAWSGAYCGTPSYSHRDDDLFIFPDIRSSVRSTMLEVGWKREAPPAETPFEEPAPWDADKASMDLEHSLLRAASNDTEPDEPVVQEVKRG